MARNKLVRDAIVRTVSRLGRHLTERTDRAQVANLIAALRPVDGGSELIRLGPNGDGGYLVPDDLAGIDYAFSPGVSTESGFEAACADRGMQVFMADYSVNGPAVVNSRFVFDKKYVGCLSNDVYMTLDDWKARRIGTATGDLLLQMDIEGAEFETLLNASAALLSQFRIMVIEFHDLQELWNRPFFGLAARVFGKLLATHTVVHNHPNNCCGSVHSAGLEIPRTIELTFHRNDRVTRRGYRTTFPHPLDRDNTGRGDLPLPRGWYT